MTRVIVASVVAVITVPVGCRAWVAVIRNKHGAVARYIHQAIALHMHEPAKVHNAESGDIHPHNAPLVTHETSVDAVGRVRLCCAGDALGRSQLGAHRERQPTKWYRNFPPP